MIGQHLGGSPLTQVNPPLPPASHLRKQNNFSHDIQRTHRNTLESIQDLIKGFEKKVNAKQKADSLIPTPPVRLSALSRALANYQNIERLIPDAPYKTIHHVG